MATALWYDEQCLTYDNWSVARAQRVRWEPAPVSVGDQVFRGGLTTTDLVGG